MQDFEPSQQDEIEALREENEELREEIQEVKQQNAGLEARFDALSKRFSRLAELVVGDVDEFGSMETSEIRDLNQRIVDLEDTVEAHEQQVAMVRVDGGTQAASPDGRAKRLRQVLYNNAKKNNGKAALNRDGVNGALGGGLHRGTVLDAMRRASNGREADINGASELPPMEAITFHAGSKRDEQSRIMMDLSDVTGSEVRQNLTTKDTDGGA